MTETTLLTFQAVGERLQRTVGFALHGTTLTRIVEQRVDSFLEHTFFVAQNHFRRLDFDKAFEAVVANDYAAVKVVEVGSGKASTIEGHERA